MEKVKITGDAGNGNGFYTDEKGRMLQAMGDTNIFVGKYVWTNGKTIYGHTTAGNEPITYTPDGVIPVLAHGRVCELLASDEYLKPFSDETYVPFKSLVNDATHAYVQMNTGEWFNVLTGENLGKFDAEDACIGDDGALLTIEKEAGYWSDGANKNMNEIRYPRTHGISDGLKGWDPNDYTHSWLELERVEPYTGSAELSYALDSFISIDNIPVQIKDSKIIVRKNGKVLTTKILPYENNLYLETKAAAEKIHASGGAAGKSNTFGYIGNDGTIHSIDIKYWDEKDRIIKTTRPRPNVQGSAAINISQLKLYSDGKFDGFMNYTASADAYPYFSHESGSIDVETGRFDLTYIRFVYEISKWDSWPFFGGEYRSADSYEKKYPNVGQFVPLNLKNNLYKDWYPVSVSADANIRISDNKIFDVHRHIAAGDVEFSGPVEMGESSPITKIPLLPEYGIYCVKHRYSVGTYMTHTWDLKVGEAIYPIDAIEGPPYHWVRKEYKKIKTEETTLHEKIINYHSTEYTNIKDKYFDPEKYGANKYWNKVDLYAQKTNLDLGGGFVAKVTLTPFSYDSTANAITIMSETNKKSKTIFTFNTSDFNYWYFHHYWADIKIGNVSSGVYALTTNQPYSSLIFVKDNESLYQEYTSGRQYSIARFRNRELLKRRLSALVKGAG